MSAERASAGEPVSQPAAPPAAAAPAAPAAAPTLPPPGKIKRAGTGGELETLCGSSRPEAEAPSARKRPAAEAWLLRAPRAACAERCVQRELRGCVLGAFGGRGLQDGLMPSSPASGVLLPTLERPPRKEAPPRDSALALAAPFFFLERSLLE